LSTGIDGIKVKQKDSLAPNYLRNSILSQLGVIGLLRSFHLSGNNCFALFGNVLDGRLSPASDQQLRRFLHQTDQLVGHIQQQRLYSTACQYLISQLRTGAAAIVVFTNGANAIKPNPSGNKRYTRD